uniref:Uncharacterized protein n=1 Tax=Pygocentrus nattereri TaxID=42514 RepID=A0AAR2KA57_PYGNA
WCLSCQKEKFSLIFHLGEANRQTLEYEVAVARRDAAVQKSSSEDRIADLRKHNQQLKTLSAELSQRLSDLERALEITRQAREEDQQGLQAELHERDRLLLSTSADNDQLQAERRRLEALLQVLCSELLMRERDAEELRVKTSELKLSADREERMRTEVESAMQRMKALEENVESERAAHLESKFNSEIIQVLFGLFGLHRALTQPADVGDDG